MERLIRCSLRKARRAGGRRTALIGLIVAEQRWPYRPRFRGWAAVKFACRIPVRVRRRRTWRQPHTDGQRRHRRRTRLGRHQPGRDRPPGARSGSRRAGTPTGLYQIEHPATAGLDTTIGAGLLVCDGSKGNFADTDHFTGGKNEGSAWDIVGGSNPKKGLLRADASTRSSATAPRSSTRTMTTCSSSGAEPALDVDGSMYLDIELNKQNITVAAPTTMRRHRGSRPGCPVQRTVGDILVAIDLEQGGNTDGPHLRVRRPGRAPARCR